MQQNFKWFCISCHHNKFRYSSVESFSCYMKKKTSIDNEKKTSIDNLKTYAHSSSLVIWFLMRIAATPSPQKRKKNNHRHLNCYSKAGFIYTMWCLDYIMVRQYYVDRVQLWTDRYIQVWLSNRVLFNPWPPTKFAEMMFRA